MQQFSESTTKKLDAMTADNGIDLETWMRRVNQCYMALLGMGADDGGDAPWADYHADGMSPLDAMAHALTDWQDDAGMLNLADIGLDGRV